MNPPLRLLLVSIVCFTIININCQDLQVTPSDLTVSINTDYQFGLLIYSDTTFQIGSSIVITFPSQYQNRLATGNYICNIDNWVSTSPQPTPVCTITGVTLTMSNLFPATTTLTDFFFFHVANIMNPFSTQPTDNFQLSMALDGGSTVIINGGSGIIMSITTMTCSVTTSPTAANQNGLFKVSFNAPQFPIGSSLQIHFSKNWPESSLAQPIIQSTTLSCTNILNSISGISCSYQDFGDSYTVTSTNIVSTSFNSSAISYSMSSILTPPTTMPQGSFNITSYYGIYQMSQCLSNIITSTTSGYITNGSFTTTSATVNAVNMGTLNFVVNSNMVTNDTAEITFPSTISLASLTSIYISNGGLTITPIISGQTVNITGFLAFVGNTITFQFTNIKNPPSQQPTSSFQITTYRHNYIVQSLVGSLVFSATRALITTASLSSSSLQIGVTSTYTLSFTIAQPLTSSSAIVIGLPTAFQGQVGSCSPSPCTVSTSQITFTSVPTTVGSTVTLSLLTVINPYTLGTSSSLSITTLLYTSQSNSVVEYVNSGLTLTFVARLMLTSNVVISSSSQVVSNYPTTISLAISNHNPLPSFTYLVVYLPPQIGYISTSSISCGYGAVVLSCSFNASTNMLALSYFSSLSISVGQLASSSVTLQYLINPASTYPTSSFAVYLYNSNSQLIQYITTGLTYSASQAANFYALTITPNNSINSASTVVSITFSVPSATYSNNTLLVVTFPAIINLASALCTAMSSNILSIITCSVNSNQIKIYFSYNSLSTTMSTQLAIGPYNNYPSLQPYTIQVDLYQDMFETSKLCSNANSLQTLQNTQNGAITISSNSFNPNTLLTSANFALTIQSASSTTFSYFVITLPQQFGSPSSCSLPALTSCAITGNSINVTSSSTISLPITLSINNLMNPSFTPSSNIYIQSFSSSGYLMDANSNILFATACTLPCKTCSSVSQPTICTSCYSNTSLVSNNIYLNSSSCVSTCGMGLYLDNSSNICSPCSPTCLTCSAYSVCLSCNSSFLYNSTCFVSCPFGYYGYNSQCVSCPTAIYCQSCTDSTHCLSCIIGYYYYNQQCYTNCPSLITYPNIVNRTCDSCPNNCTNCVGNSTLVTCTICNSGYVLDTYRCFSTCQTSGLIAVSGVCQGCYQNCQTCSILISNCTSCFSNSSSPYLVNFMCISQCSNGYYADNSTYNCLPCTSPCQFCSDSSIHSCLSCANGFYLYQTNCLSICPSFFYNSSGKCLACVSPCLTCSQQLFCLSCTNSTYLYQNQCINQCPTGMTIINGNQCLVCNSICLTCSSANVCTSCYNTTFFYNGTCLSICPNTTYANSTASLCSNCVYPCLSCTTYSYCSSCIDSTKFLINGVCVPCSSPCLTCSILISNCTACLTNTSTPYYLNYNCLPNCPSNYFSDNVTYQCSLCISPCNSCTGPTNSSCSSCIINYYLLASFCYSSCPTFYYSNITICSACQSPCLTCVGISLCTSCNNNTYLLGSGCVGSCGPGMAVINNSICSFCSTNCQTCLSANNASCTSCYSNYYLFNQSCSSSCINGYYADGTSSTCLICSTPCQYCSSISVCLSCLDSALFVVNGSCLGCLSPCLTCSGLRYNCTSCDINSTYPYLYSGSCINSCPTMYYPSATYQCLSCNSPCLNCQSASNISCTSCINGYYLLGSTCYSICPSTYYPNVTVCSGCPTPCFLCSDSNTCLSCLSNYYLQGSQCVGSCNIGMTIINGNTCQYCTSNCYTCQSSNSSTCTSCYNTTYLYNFACITNCPNGTYALSSLNTCQKCVGSCQTCSSSSYCLSCIDTTLYLINGSCVGCLSPCITCSGNRTLCLSCSVSTGYPYLYNQQCLSSCISTSYGDNSLNACVNCTSPCQSCTSSLTSSCLTCISGYLFLGGICYSSCPNKYYSNGTACVGCNSPCANCYDSTTCISCDGGLYLEGSSCTANCSIGMILINNSYCSFCSNVCLTCLSSNSSFCTSCQNGLFLQSGSCLINCPSTFYGDNTTYSCKACKIPCDTCTSDTSCLSCLDSSLFLVNYTCVNCLSPCLTCSTLRSNCTSCDILSQYNLLVNNTCLSTCPTGYYVNVYSCLKCNSPCQTCLNSSISSCITCLSGYVLYGSNCLLNCPSGYYSNTINCSVCSNGCATCSSTTICLSCPPSFYLIGSNCGSSCPNGTITSNTSLGGVCQVCQNSCPTCLSSNYSYCTSCLSNMYLSAGACSVNCSSGFYGNNVLWICAGCSTPCKTCQSPSVCLSCLDSTTFLINSTCIGCVSLCLTCSQTINNCTSCNNTGPYPYFYVSSCVSVCPNTFYNDSTYFCNPCKSPCYNCYGPGNQDCLTCISGYYQLGSICYVACPSGYYNYTGQCLLCTSPCLSCINSGNNSCTSCNGGLYLLGSTCQSNCSGMTINGSNCVYCTSTCATCLTNINSYCTSCQSGLYLYNGLCLSNCSSGLYADSNNSVCLPCINNCGQCTSAIACLTCRDSTLFLINSSCVSCSSICLTCSVTINNCTSCNSTSSYPILFNFECISACPSTYYNDTLLTCTKCASPCSTCSGAGTQSCVSCLSSYYLLSNVCYSACPIGYYPNLLICSICTSPCFSCFNNPTTCTSCITGYYLRGSICSSNCSSGEVLINNTYCQVCSTYCGTCLSQNYSYCTTCPSGYYLLNGVCYSSCPVYYYSDTNSSTCISCKIPCLACTSATICLSCLSSTPFLVSNFCYSCSIPCLTCSNTQNNCTSCNISTTNPYYYNFNCLTKCPDTYYVDGSSNCMKCNYPCQTCSTSSNISCLSCAMGYSQLANACYANCPSTYYSNGTYCLSCSSSCQTCIIANNSCLSCPNGLYLYGSSCISGCPTGMIVINGTICGYCTGGCLTCLSSNSSFCTACYNGSFTYQGTCISTCPSQFFTDSSSGTCKACTGLCLTCQSLSNCLSCLNPLYYIQNFACVSSCTYPLIGINSTCYQCSSQCLTCTQSVSTCLLCASGFYYFPATFVCSLYCSYYVLASNQSTSGNNECTQTCPTGTYASSTSQYCQICPTGCKTCGNATYCSLCVSGYSYYLYFCYSPCPSFAPYSINSNCIMCNIVNCQTCLNTTYCSTCSSSYLLISQGNSSTCISSCPTSYIYSLSTLSCIYSNTQSNSTGSSSSNIVNSSIPPYTFLITCSVLVFLTFIIKLKFINTFLSMTLFICITSISSCCLINLLLIEIQHGMNGYFNQLSVSTAILLSSGGLQAVVSLVTVFGIVKISDPAVISVWKEYPIVFAALLLLSMVDPNIFLMTTSQILNFSCFKVKFESDSMQRLFKGMLISSLAIKLLNLSYSFLQINYYNVNAYRLLSTASFPINSSYTIQFAIISGLALLFIIYLIYQFQKSEKIENFKEDSHHSLMDAQVFDKRNSSNSQIMLEIDNSDLVVDINSIKDENEISFNSQTKRFKTNKKVTPDEMLEKMNQGITQQEKEQTQVVDQKQEVQGQQRQPELIDVNNLFFMEESPERQNNDNDTKQKSPQKKDQDQQLIDNNSKEIINMRLIQELYETIQQSKIGDLSQILYNQSNGDKSKVLENQVNAIREVVKEDTKTEVINIFSIDNNATEEKHEKYSPLSVYKPNHQIEKEFANSYLDDANKFNEHIEEKIQQERNKINFEVENNNFNEQESIQEISFQKKENFVAKIPQKDEQKEIKDRREQERLRQDQEIAKILEDEVPKMSREEPFQQQYLENIQHQTFTPISNGFFDQEEDQYKPSEGLRGKINKRPRKKPEIPLPKNEMQKQIMNIYQKKDKKQTIPLPPKKKRYPDIPNPSKQSKFVEYSIEDKDFYEQKMAKPIFSGEIKKEMPRYNQQRSSENYLYDQQFPEKPSLKLRKSSFKKIGEMIIDSQSQQSARK